MLRADLRRVRRTGIAVDREEIAPDFCCIAAPLLDEQRRFLGAIGISMSVRAFDDGARGPQGDPARHRPDSRHVRIVAKFLIAARTAGLASGEHLAVKRRLRQRR